MFGIGGFELVVIVLVTVVVIGPSELPRVLYNLGKGMAKLREFSKSMTDGFDVIAREGELDDIVAKANQAGDTDTDFRIEQQKALEARAVTEETEDSGEEDSPDENDDLKD